MRILQLGKYYHPVQGGIETHVKTLCEGLAKRHRVTCAVSSTSFVGGREKMNGVSVVRFGKLVPGWKPINPLLPGFVRKNARKFDVVHVHMPSPSAELSCLFARPKRLIVTYHADVVGKVGGTAYRWMQRRVLEKADKILVSSKEYRDSSPVLKPFRKKCVVVPLGVDIARFSPKAGKGAPVFLFVGRLVAYKGLPFLLKAMKSVKGELMIAGEGPLRRKLERRARRLGVARRVKFLGGVAQKELPGLYQKAGVVVLPSISRAEAFGIVQVEAMASGRPVISTRLRTGVEVVNQHGKTGLVVPPKNAYALAKAMSRLGSSAALRRRMGAAGGRRAKGFTVGRMVERVLACYAS